MERKEMTRTSKCSGDQVTSPNETENERNPRGNWTRQIEFTLSSVGYTVGLGNIWRFPYFCMRNGGGAFLIPYFILLVVCGLPLYFMELIIGQFSNRSTVAVWKLSPIFKGVGYGMVVVSAIMSVYFNVIIAWILYFLGMSFRADVPWKTCDNSWNTPQCITLVKDKYNVTSNSSFPNGMGLSGNATHQEHSIGVSTNVSFKSGMPRSAAEEFWTYNVLDLSDGIDDLGHIKWDLLLCLAAAWLLVFVCLCKGVKSLGKVVYITVTVPYLFLTILLIRGVTLPGSLDGIKFYLFPDWSKLLQFNVWFEACTQIFYSLGPAWGSITTMASYNRFDNNILRDTVIVCVACGGTSFFAGFVIFSVVGFMAHAAELPIEQVITQGPSLAFVAYPEALANLPLSPLWAICFFLMLLTIGLDSQRAQVNMKIIRSPRLLVLTSILIIIACLSILFSALRFGLVETIVTGLTDEFPGYLRHRKTLFLSILAFVLFLLGLPMITKGGMYIFQVIDWYSTYFSVPLLGLIECLAVSYIYGVGRVYHDISLMLKRNVSVIWAVCWCLVTPSVILVMIVVSTLKMKPPTYGDYEYPGWVQVMGWFISILAIIPIPLAALCQLLNAKGSFVKRLYTLMQPESDWGPVSDDCRKQYKYNTGHHGWKERLDIRTPSQEINGTNEAIKGETITLEESAIV